MSNQKLLGKNSVSTTKLFDHGEMKEESKPLKVKEDSVSTMSKNLSTTKEKTAKKRRSPKRRNTSIVVSRQINKKRISNVKSSISQKNTQNIKSSKKSQVELTLKGRVSKGFWTKSHTELSQKLWLPTETGYVGSHGNTSNGCLTDIESVSWSTAKKIRQLPQNKNSQKTCFQSSMYSLRGTTVNDGNILRQQAQKSRIKTVKNQETKQKAKKTKNNLEYKDVITDSDTVLNYVPSCSHHILLPSKNQKRIFSDNFAAIRKVWNVSLHYIHKTKLSLHEITDFSLRDRFITRKQMEPKTIKELEWTFRTQKRIREYAVKDLVASIKGGLTRLKKKQIYKFRTNFKQKNDTQQSMVLCHENSYIKNNKLHVYGMDIPLQEKIADMKPISHNMRLVKEGSIYHLYIPKFSEFRYKDETVNEKLVSIDLGVNIFANYYSPDFEWGEVGLGLKEKLHELYVKQEKIKNNPKIHSKRRYKITKKYEDRIFNLIDDLQWKSAHWFLKSYKEILVSRLYVCRANKETKRFMNDTKHCRFVDRLIYLSMFYKDRIIHVGKEHYTSQHCTKCGSLDTVKNSIVSCNSCNFKIHRDLSGSRNFLLKYLV